MYHESSTWRRALCANKFGRISQWIADKIGPQVQRGGRFFEPLEERHLLSVTINDLQLTSDTGESGTDRVTTNTDLVATVDWTSGEGHVEVQFDHNGDGTHEGFADVATSGGGLAYDPRDHGLAAGYVGLLPLKYRAVEYDASETVVSTGDWADFPITIASSVAAEIAVLNGQAELTDGVSVVSFPNTMIGAPVSKAFSISNRGAATLSLDPQSLQLPTGFSLLGSLATSVAPGATTALTIRLDATAAGTFSGGVALGNGDADGNENPFNFNVSGQVAELVPEIVVLDAGAILIDGVSTVQMGSAPVGAPITKTFAIHNVGGVPLTLDTWSVVLPTGYSLESAFDISVAPWGSTSFTVRLDASEEGTFAGAFSFTNNDSDESPFSFNLSGQVTAPQPEIVVTSPSANLVDGFSSVAFSTTPVGLPISQVFTIRNIGAGDLQLNAGSLVVPAGFSLENWSDNTLAAGESTTFVVRLDAAAVGNYGGQVSFTSNDSDESPFSFLVQGEVTGLEPEIAVSVGSMNLHDGASLVTFGQTPQDTPVAKTFTIVNTGQAMLAVDPQSFVLPAGYSLHTPPASTVPPGASTTFVVRLNATAGGFHGGQLAFTSNDSDESLFTFSVSGTVTLPKAEIVVTLDGANLVDGLASVPFGDTPVGSAQTRTLTIQNIGGAALTLVPASLVLPAGFSLVDPFDAVVAPGASTSLTVRLDATASGFFAGQLSFETSDVDEGLFNISVLGRVAAPLAAAPAVEDLHLVNDTGTAGDKITSDMRVAGTLVREGFSVDGLAVQFDVHGDGLSDGFVFTNAQGDFVVDPKTVRAFPGPVSVWVRGGAWDTSLLNYRYGDWEKFTFTYQETATVSGPPVVSGLELVRDTGIPDDEITSIAWIGGTVSLTAGAGSHLPVEFDLNNDGVAEGMVRTEVSGSGEFMIDLTNQLTESGVVELKVRAGAPDPLTGGFAYGAWVAFTFSYVMPAPTAPSDPQLQLPNVSYAVLKKASLYPGISIQDEGELEPFDGAVPPGGEFESFEEPFKAPTQDGGNFTISEGDSDVTTETFTESDGSVRVVETTLSWTFDAIGTNSGGGDWTLDEDRTDTYLVVTTYEHPNGTSYTFEQSGSHTYDYLVTATPTDITYSLSESITDDFDNDWFADDFDALPDYTNFATQTAVITAAGTQTIHPDGSKTAVQAYDV